MDAGSKESLGTSGHTVTKNLELEFLQSGFDHLSYGAAIFDADQNLVRCNRPYLEIRGLPEEFGEPGTPFGGMMRYAAEHGEFGDGESTEQVTQGTKLAENFEEYHFRHVRFDGTVLEVEGLVLPGGGFLSTYTLDDHSRESSSMAERLGRILDMSQNEIYVFDANTLKFVQVNQGAIGNLGYTLDEFREMTPVDIKPEIVNARFSEMIEPLRAGHKDRIIFETVHMRKDGTIYPVEIRLQLSTIENPPVFVAIVEDIAERKKAQETIWRQANFDVLTQLPNRMVFRDRLEMAQLQSERNDRMVALHFLDLDHFKDVNDTEGHTMGDVLLKEVAKRLKGAIRKSDTVARLGGDEFAIIQTSIRHVDDAENLAVKVLETMTAPFGIGGKKVYIGVSIGITIYPLDDRGPDDLLRNADIAMYVAKNNGRNRYEFYAADMGDAIKDRNQLEQDLRQAMEDEVLFLHYQPKVDTLSGEIIGIEALLRWEHPELGRIPPDEFIPIAEKSGLIDALGTWVLRTACIQNKAWQDMGLKPVEIAVNLSPVQFRHADLVKVIRDTIEESGLDAQYLELEITESTAMDDPAATAEILEQVTRLGVKISLDDFGTGYSSLAYLKRFPLSRIKIDKSFVSDLLSDSEDAAIVNAVINLGQSLNMKVTAEGVEEKGQEDYLTENGCDEMQGYRFSYPVAAEFIPGVLSKRSGGT